MERLNYFLGRLLLIIPTFFGITLVCFFLTQILPGGPIDQALSRIKQAAMETSDGVAAIPPEQIEYIKKQYRFDKPILMRYWMWLVNDRVGMQAQSYRYPHMSVWQVISERFPVSLSFGIPGFILSYLICIPLGVAKALRNGKPFDIVSSVVVFTLYAIPSFALGLVLKMLFCGTSDVFWDIFPLGGFESEGFAEMTLGEKVADRLHHMFLPMICYIIGSFAVMTLLMKNSLLEQINQDYVRTVLAKGAGIDRAIWRHTIRNSLIPIVTGIGGVLTIMFAGNVLIEKVFDIKGIGQLSLEAVVDRDYMVFMGILALVSILGLLGQIISDLCYILVDPRINFGRGRS